jgi:hypothetical protein
VDWPAITRRLAGPMGGLGDGITHSFALSVLPLMTAVAVGALAWLVAYLGPVESNVSATQHSELCAGGSNRTRGAEKEG